jgi:hypothetical protein
MAYWFIGLLVYYTHQALLPQTKKREELSFFSSVPPQVVPVSLCVPGQPDFRTLVWLWSSKNVASPNQ